MLRPTHRAVAGQPHPSLAIHPDPRIAVRLAVLWLRPQRFALLQQRISRNKLFSRPALGSAGPTDGHRYCELTPLQALLGTAGEQHYVMGSLSQLEDGRFYLEDLTASIQVDLSTAATTAGLFTENCIVVAEGTLNHHGVFEVSALGFPPAEKREETRAVTVGLDFFGGGCLRCGVERQSIPFRSENPAVPLHQIALSCRQTPLAPAHSLTSCRAPTAKQLPSQTRQHQPTDSVPPLPPHPRSPLRPNPQGLRAGAAGAPLRRVPGRHDRGPRGRVAGQARGGPGPADGARRLRGRGDAARGVRAHGGFPEQRLRARQRQPRPHEGCALRDNSVPLWRSYPFSSFCLPSPSFVPRFAPQSNPHERSRTPPS